MTECRYQAWQCNIKWCAGHVHKQGKHTDERGVHHHVMPALVETPPEVGACHGIVTVLEHGLKLQGFGSMESCTMPLVGMSSTDAHLRPRPVLQYNSPENTVTK